MPKVSVIVPVYNVEKYLQACIDSLMSQTLQDIEAIFIDDASPDGCWGILQKNALIYPDKMKVIHLEENLRQGGARNVGIKLAQGEYIGFVDSDDFVSHDMYEKLYNKIIETNADMVCGRYTQVREEATIESVKDENSWISTSQWKTTLKNGGGYNYLTIEEKMDFIVSSVPVVCAIYKKDVIVQNNIWFPEHIRYEDNYWCTLLKCYIQSVYFLEDIFYYYRLNSNSTIRAKNVEVCYERIKIENILYKELTERGFLTEYHSAIEYINITRYALNTFGDFFHKSEKLPKKDMIALVKDVKKKFPNWKRNKYFQENYTGKQKLKVYIAFGFPRLFILICKILKI